MKPLFSIPIIVMIALSQFANAQWSITGNSGIDPVINFLGTTDSKNLIIRTNNVERMRITSGGKIGFGTTSPSTTFDLKGTFKAGGVTGYCKIDTSGNLTFNGNGALRIANGKYIFRLAVGTNGGGFYDKSNNRFELRDTFATRIFSVGIATGDGYLKGGLQLGNSTNNIAGNLRWTGTDFEGYKGASWVSLTGGGGSGANTSLSNLITTSLNQALLPSSSNTLNVGSSALGWKNIYATGSIFLDGTKFIDNSGTDNTLVGNTGNTAITGSSNTVIGSTAGASLNSGSHNSFFGTGAGFSNTTGNYNSFFGEYAGYSNTSGYENTFFGRAAGLSNTTGYYNTFFGEYAGYTNTTGFGNTATGTSAFAYNTTGSYNTANGFEALYYNTTGSDNTAYGYEALYFNTTGVQNTANGGAALYHNTTGIGNLANGYGALYYNSTGSNNTANGVRSLYSNTTGFSCTANGAYALQQNTTGEENTATGFNALLSNTIGYDNTANGVAALYSNTTGNSNIAIGHMTLYSNTTGSYNTANGVQALYFNTTGSNNTVNGVNALYFNTTGSNNTASGDQALYWNNDSNNTAIGTAALYNNGEGASNTAVGVLALFKNDAGDYNTAVGYDAGGYDAEADYNTIIGALAGVSGSTGQESDATAIGYNAVTNANNKIVIGTSANNNLTGGYGAWQNFSDGRFKDNVQGNVPGLSFITKLHPVTYNLNAEKVDQFLGIKQRMDTSKNAKAKAWYLGRLKVVSAQLQTGFIAQEVEATAKSIGYDFDGVHHPESDYDNYTIGYATFVVPLVKAVQELDSMNNEKADQVKSLQSTVDDLQNENAALKTRLDKMDQTMQQFDQSLAECCSNYKSGGSFFGGDQSADAPKLEQNIPNPFDQMTVIKFYLPQTATTAVIKIYSLDGVELKSFNVNQKGYGEISLAGNSLASGVYAYTLIIDGQAIDTKQMILTK